MPRLPLLLLSTSFLVSSIRRFVPSEQACQDLITDMRKRYVEQIEMNTLDRIFAGKFYADCPRFQVSSLSAISSVLSVFKECLKQKYPPQSVEYGCCFGGDHTHEGFLQTTCRIAEILAGPLGSCFDYVSSPRTFTISEIQFQIRFYYNRTQLIECFYDRATDENREKYKLDLWKSGCDSTVNSCVEDIVEKHCRPEAYQIYQSKAKTLITTNCVGCQMFTQREYNQYVRFHDEITVSL